MSLAEFKSYSSQSRISDYSQLIINQNKGIFEYIFYIEASNYSEAIEIIDNYLHNLTVGFGSSRVSKIFYTAGRRDKVHVTCKNGTHAYLFKEGDFCDAVVFVRESSLLANRKRLKFTRRFW